MGKVHISAFLVLKPCSLLGVCPCSSQIRNITDRTTMLQARKLQQLTLWSRSFWER